MSSGGGVRSIRGSLNVIDSIVTNNTVRNSSGKALGAGLQVINGDAFVDRTTVSYNSEITSFVGSDGGGVYFANGFDSGSFPVQSSKQTDHMGRVLRQRMVKNRDRVLLEANC